MTLSEVPKGQPKADSDYFAKERFYSLFGRILSHRIDRQRRKHIQHIVSRRKKRAITGPFFFFATPRERRVSQRGQQRPFTFSLLFSDECHPERAAE
jgi:hypothetical protein